MKIKGRKVGGFMRLYFNGYGNTPFMEFQFNCRSCGIGVSWCFGGIANIIELNLLFINIAVAL